MRVTHLTRISRAKTLLQHPPKIMAPIRTQSCNETCIVNAASVDQVMARLAGFEDVDVLFDKLASFLLALPLGC